MNAIDILSNLLPYQSLLKRLVAHEHAHLSAIPAFTKPTTRIRNQYDFITLYLGYLSEQDGPHRPIANLYCEVRLKLNGTVAVVERVHCEEKSRTQALEALVKTHVTAPRNAWNLKLETKHYHSDAVTKYLAIADGIAGPARNCTHGDDYRPGNFSEISVDEDFIILSQINHMNAKSLAHKEDYSLRDLVFTIPLGEARKRQAFDDVMIGEMQVAMSDLSSAPNRSCGAAIAERIAQAQQSFV
jgi:hypothetical protein